MGKRKYPKNAKTRKKQWRDHYGNKSVMDHINHTGLNSKAYGEKYARDEIRINKEFREHKHNKSWYKRHASYLRKEAKDYWNIDRKYALALQGQADVYERYSK